MKFGIVGAGGYWGPNWVRVLKQAGVLYAICDSDTDRLDAVTARFDLVESGVTVHVDYAEMLSSGLDAVFVVTPPDTHAELAAQALQLGLHVFIEKPMASNLEDCYRIKFEAGRAERLVMVGHTFVFHPAVQLFKEMLPRVGDVRTLYTIRTSFGQYQEVGLIFDLLPHDLSIFGYLLDAETDTVMASVNPHQDVGFVSAVYGRIACNSFLGWACPDKTRKLVAVGDKGILEWNLRDTRLIFHRKWVVPAAGKYQHFDEGVQTILIDDQSEPLMNEARHFIHCIETGEQPLTSIEQGIGVVKGLEACR